MLPFPMVVRNRVGPVRDREGPPGKGRTMRSTREVVVSAISVLFRGIREDFQRVQARAREARIQEMAEAIRRAVKEPDTPVPTVNPRAAADRPPPSKASGEDDIFDTAQAMQEELVDWLIEKYCPDEPKADPLAVMLAAAWACRTFLDARRRMVEAGAVPDSVFQRERRLCVRILLETKMPVAVSADETKH